MKSKINYLILLLPITLFFAGCDKDDDDNKPDEDSLAEYFYCDINGVHFNPTSDFNCNSRTFGFYPESADGISAGYLVIGGRHCSGGDNFVALRFFGFEPNQELLDFIQPTFADSCFPLFKNEDLRFEELISGQMDIQHFRPRISEEKGLVEGTFECKLKNTETDSIVNITNGYFRFRIEHTW
jgi:hypothetical protein